jgi:hypothetical protein
MRAYRASVRTDGYASSPERDAWFAKPIKTSVRAGADGIPCGVGEGISAFSSVQVIASMLTMSPAHGYAETRSTPYQSDIRPVAMPVAAGHLVELFARPFGACG